MSPLIIGNCHYIPYLLATSNYRFCRCSSPSCNITQVFEIVSGLAVGLSPYHLGLGPPPHVRSFSFNSNLRIHSGVAERKSVCRIGDVVDRVSKISGHVW